MSLLKKVLITGITGQIGQYVRDVFEADDNYEIIGTSRHESGDLKIIQLDLSDSVNLERFLLRHRPDIIIHLAGISNLEECAANPDLAIRINGLVISNICEIIYRHALKCVLFNASSSEIYKGHINYVVKEDDMCYRANNPYGISKVLGHSLVDYYRDVRRMPFSNGIIFTTESRHRPDGFLLKKVANHIKRWLANDREPITVGCLQSYRTLLHAHDVATAIKKIVEQKAGGNYLICGDEHLRVEEIVARMFDTANIPIKVREDGIYSSVTDELIIRISGSMRGITTNIHGDCQKLKHIGWKQTYSLDDICKDHLS